MFELVVKTLFYFALTTTIILIGYEINEKRSVDLIKLNQERLNE